MWLSDAVICTVFYQLKPWRQLLSFSTIVMAVTCITGDSRQYQLNMAFFTLAFGKLEQVLSLWTYTLGLCTTSEMCQWWWGAPIIGIPSERPDKKWQIFSAWPLTCHQDRRYYTSYKWPIRLRLFKTDFQGEPILPYLTRWFWFASSSNL